MHLLAYRHHRFRGAADMLLERQNQLFRQLGAANRLSSAGLLDHPDIGDWLRDAIE